MTTRVCRLLGNQPPRLLRALQFRSEECLQGLGAAHCAAFQTAAQMLGGLAAAAIPASRGDMLPNIVADLHFLTLNVDALSIDASLMALFSEAAVRLAAALPEVSLPNGMQPAACAITMVCKGW